MQMTPKGRISVTTPGTPVPLTTDPTITACKLFFQVIPGLSGKTYVGNTGMNKSTLAGVNRVLWPNATGGFSETFLIENYDDENSIRVADYSIDADVAGEGLLVTWWTN